MMPYERRRRLLAHRKLQSALLVRVTVYWFYCLLSITLFAACWIVITRRPTSAAALFQQVWFSCGPAMAGSILLLPLVLFDSLRLSHRFAGPMVRIRRAIRELADGEPASQVKLREADYWQDVASDVNRLIVQREAQRAQLPPEVADSAADTAAVADSRSAAAELPAADVSAESRPIEASGCEALI